jgi:hypothetical protein
VPQPPFAGSGSKLGGVGASATPSTVALTVPWPAALAVTVVMNVPVASVVPLADASVPSVLASDGGRPGAGSPQRLPRHRTAGAHDRGIKRDSAVSSGRSRHVGRGCAGAQKSR